MNSFSSPLGFSNEKTPEFTSQLFEGTWKEVGSLSSFPSEPVFSVQMARANEANCRGQPYAVTTDSEDVWGRSQSATGHLVQKEETPESRG